MLNAQAQPQHLITHIKHLSFVYKVSTVVGEITHCVYYYTYLYNILYYYYLILFYYLFFYYKENLQFVFVNTISKKDD